MTDATKRRNDRVFEPSFIEDLERLTVEDVRARKSECEELEAELSFSRRLLQGKMDILREAMSRRSAGGQAGAEQLIHRLPRILADDETGESFKRHSPLVVPKNADLQRREIERLTADVAHADELTDEQLAGLVDTLTQAESRASEERRRIQKVVDRLNAELVRRYREGEADPSSLLTS